ncbi:MAG TPA: SDR family NAD(P)-dependent oxidoreductase, partial [Candidatus Acidoferrum sp.]|nr:SDR family NAD(P)-dependent oxidoreductase [Candidatus Acidoferrum sp.]
SLAKQGATLLLHGRNVEKGKALVAELERTTGNNHVRYYNADLSSLAQVRKLAAEIKQYEPRLNVLVNNAGIGPREPGSPRELSTDGYEKFFAVNYLAGYLLTHELLPLLRQSTPARIVNVASIGQQPLDFSDVMLTHDYDDSRAYRQSKLAQILFTFDLAETLKGSGITVNCLHPATLMNTNMVKDSRYFKGALTTVEEGAAAVERLIVAPELAAVTGQYFDGVKPAQPNAQALDAEARWKLRELSEHLVLAGK